MFLRRVNTFTVTGVLVALTLIGIAATRPQTPPGPPQNPPPQGPPPPGNEKAKNLKVLPKNISHKDLDSVMDGFKAALGVKCNFCHAANKDTSIHRLDFPSDDKEEKEIARHMMRMTEKINKKYFSFAKDDKGDLVRPVQCFTCHRGKPHPGDN